MLQITLQFILYSFSLPSSTLYLDPIYIIYHIHTLRLTHTILDGSLNITLEQIHPHNYKQKFTALYPNQSYITSVRPFSLLLHTLNCPPQPILFLPIDHIEPSCFQRPIQPSISLFQNRTITIFIQSMTILWVLLLPILALTLSNSIYTIDPTLFALAQSSSVSAMDSTFPCRNGRIYAIYQNSMMVLFSTMITFNSALPSIPRGVTLGIRSMENINQDTEFVDISFKINNVYQSYFEITGNIGSFETMYFSKFILDYITSTCDGIYTFSEIPVTNFGKVNNTVYTLAMWVYNTPIASYNTQGLHFYFLIELNTKFNNGGYNITIKDQYTDAFQKTVEAKITGDVEVTSINLNVLCYDEAEFSGLYPDYKFGHENIVTFENQSSFLLYDTPSEYLWVGINVFLGTTTRFNFDIKYSIEFSDSSYSSITPHRSFQILQSPSQHFQLNFYIFYFMRQNCLHQPSYPMILKPAQLCFDACPAGTIEIPSQQQCYYCSDVSQNCVQCAVDSSTLAVTCTMCSSDSNYYLVNNQCLQCGDDQFFNSTSMVCITCASALFNCSACNLDGVECFECSSSSETQLVSGACLPCNSSSYFHSTTRQCLLCDSTIPSCSQCGVVAGVLQCQQCESDHKRTPSSCTPCPVNQNYDSVQNDCYSCSAYCSSCDSATNCLVCETIPGQTVDLVSGQCVIIPEPIDSPTDCVLGYYNTTTNTCESSVLLSTAVTSFTTISSIPTVNLAFNSLASLFGLLDDLSYYSYHNRNYSRAVSVYFRELGNYTLQRFLPSQLTSLYQSLQLNYSDSILLQDMNKSPATFSRGGDNIYFLRNTEKFWGGTLPMSCLSFILLGFINWFSNKFVYKNTVLKRYSYAGMILVDLIGCNIQFLTFRCASQLFQTVPIGSEYLGNLIFCYVVMFSVLLYSTGSIIVFKSIYSELSTQYVTQELFGSFWIVRFIFSNIFKLITGFVHAYYYYDPTLQSLLLLIIYSCKAILYTFTMHRVKNKFQYTFDSLCLYLMVVLSGFFYVQLILTQEGMYDDRSEETLGGIESTLIIVCIVFQIVNVVVVVVQEGVQLGRYLYQRRGLMFKRRSKKLKCIEEVSMNRRQLMVVEVKRGWESRGHKREESGWISKLRIRKESQKLETESRRTRVGSIQDSHEI